MTVIDTGEFEKRLKEIHKKMESIAEELRSLQGEIDDSVGLAEDVTEQLKYAVDRMSEQY